MPFTRPSRPAQLPRLTLIGRASVLLVAELLANAVAWTAAGICFRGQDALLSLALLAWTIGLRHALDADHISAIDNATRQLVSHGQLPITCGLFFSLGHSTIVVVVNVAIAISVDIYSKLDAVGSVGGIVGTAISASFLFLIACLNTFFLFQAIRERRRARNGGMITSPADGSVAIQGGGCLVRIIAPVLRAVDRPWKMYPVGVLFGFGFDTASSIALLAISAVAQGGTDGQGINHGKLVIFPVLFTTGMTMVDSLDSILMVYAYAQPDLRSSGRFLLLEKAKAGPDLRLQEPLDAVVPAPSSVPGLDAVPDAEDDVDLVKPVDTVEGDQGAPQETPAIRETRDHEVGATNNEDEWTSPGTERAERILANKAQTMSTLSISLTLMSILVALSISLIEIMGLIGDNCVPCQEAANDPDGGGLAGHWWRAWGAANDASGYIGAAVVGSFVVLLVVYHVGRWGWSRYRRH